ncbi:MAG: hypothetical protein AAF557_17115 [Pseudomonadota bacterium]
MTRLTKAVPEHLRRGRKTLEICTFACRSVPQVTTRALPYIGLSLTLLVLGQIMSAFNGTASLGYFLKLLAAGPAVLAAFWVQWQASSHVGSETDFDPQWLYLPPRRWMEKTLPLAFVLGVGLVLLLPFGTNLWPTSTFGMIVWPLFMTTLAMLALLIATGISSVAAAQEIDADTSGYSRAGGQVFLINCLICLISLTAITLVMGPLMFLVAITFGIGEGWTLPFLLTGQIVFIWAAGSTAAAYLLEDRLWHTEFYN